MKKKELIKLGFDKTFAAYKADVDYAARAAAHAAAYAAYAADAAMIKKIQKYFVKLVKELKPYQKGKWVK